MVVGNKNVGINVTVSGIQTSKPHNYHMHKEEYISWYKNYDHIHICAGVAGFIMN